MCGNVCDAGKQALILVGLKGGNMNDQMDAIDTKQQREIDDLKTVNERQDSYIKNIIWSFVLFAIIQFATMIMFMQSYDRDCPHDNCPHHAPK
jgi:pheromone shutdown protein TraB